MEGLLERATPTGGEDRCGSPAAGGSPQHRLLRGYLHKTSNTLCGIKGYASLIADPDRVSGDSARWAEKILREIEKMEHIFRSVADLTSPRSASLVDAQLAGVVQASVAEARANHPQLTVETGPLPAARLLLPAADLAQVIREILANSAACAAEVGRPIKVVVRGLTKPDGTIDLTLADDGPGLSPEMLGQVKDPFVTTRPGSLGIGLTRVDTIMEMHNLPWSLTSELGNGTLVSLGAAALG